MKPNIVVVSASLVLLFALAATVGADRTPPDIVQASKVIGKAVVNAEGRSIGSIEDLAIDELDGQIRYAVLSFGGVLGMGGKHFAIPWEAFERSEDHERFILDVAEEDLKRAPGFDKDHWPDFVDPVYYTMIYEFYRIPVPGAEAKEEAEAKRQR
ncbi:hypothetical protein YTPLAS18_15320 [Nitrospira sp.]|nr:hypothetical protein YTPLAS18_15320 [Nitrospira sp.]